MSLSVFLTGLTIMTINSKMTRKDELEYAVSTATQQTLKEMVMDDSDVTDENAVRALFTRNLFMNIQSDSEITIQFKGIDIRKGLLSVNVCETYKNILGYETELSVTKTAIYE